jgi:glucose/arabinose dehydrogenase
VVAIGAVAAVAAVLGVVVLSRDDGSDEAASECGTPVVDAPAMAVSGTGPAVGFEAAGFEGEYVTAMAQRRDGRTFFLLREGALVQRTGDEDEELLDLEPALVDERGALGLALAPDEAHLYVTYTPDEESNVLVEYPVTEQGIDPAGARELLRLPNEAGQHLMNNVVFGPDGYLYVGVGDATSPRTVEEGLPVAQDPGDLRGKILRIDPSGGDPYLPAPDNPFVDDADAAPEVFALGLRNPWRFSFDGASGDLWLADVGANCGEEIDLIPAGESGSNFGWSVDEAVYRLAGADPVDGATAPVLWYPRLGEDEVLRCAAIGGFVYRGEAIDGLQGRYVFGDLCDPTIYAADFGGGDPTVESLGLLPSGQLLAFGQDLDGELYVLTTDGASRLVAG